MELVVDHLWQSALCVALIWLLSQLLRENPASFRLWLWRIAALKLLLPFSLLYVLGAWLGFPVRHSAIPPPAALSEAAASLMPWLSPTQSAQLPMPWLAAAACAAVTGAVVILRWILQRLRAARREFDQERSGEESGGAPTTMPLNFPRAIAISATAAGCLAVPLLGGALHDRALRQQVLAVDTRDLHGAVIRLVETPTRFGARTEIIAQPEGVLIRYINLQGLVAMTYGLGQFEVFGGALPWLEHPHYDVRVTGKVMAPALFDPYSLRQPVTSYLAREYGLAIRVNGDCQEPCLNHESIAVERIPWGISQSSRAN